MFRTSGHSNENGPDSGVLGVLAHVLRFLALGFGSQLSLLQGRQRDAVYQH